MTCIFVYLTEKENLLFEVREREWLLNAELEEERAITNLKMQKGKIYKVKLASFFHSFSTEFYPRDSQHRVRCANTVLPVMTDSFVLLKRTSGAARGRQAEHHNYRNRITYMHRNRNPCNYFFMVNMVSGMVRGRVRPTTTTASRNMLSSIGTCQNKVSAVQYHVPISRVQVQSSFRSCDQVLVFDWIAGSCQVNLAVRKPLTQDQKLTDV